MRVSNFGRRKYSPGRATGSPGTVTSRLVARGPPAAYAKFLRCTALPSPESPAFAACEQTACITLRAAFEGMFGWKCPSELEAKSEATTMAAVQCTPKTVWRLFSGPTAMTRPSSQTVSCSMPRRPSRKGGTLCTPKWCMKRGTSRTSKALKNMLVSTQVEAYACSALR